MKFKIIDTSYYSDLGIEIYEAEIENEDKKVVYANLHASSSSKFKDCDVQILNMPYLKSQRQTNWIRALDITKEFNELSLKNIKTGLLTKWNEENKIKTRQLYVVYTELDDGSFNQMYFSDIFSAVDEILAMGTKYLNKKKGFLDKEFVEREIKTLTKRTVLSNNGWSTQGIKYYLRPATQTYNELGTYSEYNIEW